jgi:2,3-bisphosphoglycerate-dependent phosphoglycerate mutase
MRVFLVRHGDKAYGDFWNEAIGGHNDNPLSEKGRAEAEAAAAWLAPRGIGAIRASRYGRTSETAAPLARALGLEVLIDPRLDEIDVGLTDRLSDAEIEARFPGFLALYRAFDSDFSYPGGESGGEVALRVASFLASALEAGVDTVAYCHDGYVRIAACLVLGLPYWARRSLRADTCGISELEWNGGAARWDLVRLNAK